MSKLSDFLGGTGGAGFGSLPVQVVSTDTTVKSNTSVGINTYGGEVTVTMPANPKVGDMLVFFDAALTWDKFKANVNTSGIPVQYQEGDLTSFEMSEKSGILNLLYVDINTGWVDTSYYETGVDPIWYGSQLERDSELRVLTGQSELYKDYEESDSFIVEDEGLYVFVIVGGSGGYRGGSGNNGKAGNTIVKINEESVATAIGARNAGRPSQVYENPKIIFYRDMYRAVQVEPTKVFTLALPVNEEIEDIQLTPLDFPLIKRPGGRLNSDNIGYGSTSSSFSYHLNAGDEVAISVGAAGTGAYESYYGRSGKAQIYKMS